MYTYVDIDIECWTSFNSGKSAGTNNGDLPSEPPAEQPGLKSTTPLARINDLLLLPGYTTAVTTTAYC